MNARYTPSARLALSLLAGLLVAALAVGLSAQATQAPAPQNDAVTALTSQQRSQIHDRGYQAGYSAGRADAQQGATYNFQTQPAYASGIQGFTGGSDADLTAYRAAFRAGFENGYDDGFYGRANNPAAQPARTYAGTAAANPSAQAMAPAGSQPAAGAVVPTGTTIQVKLDNSLSAANSQAGDPFSATVAEPVMAANGATLIPVGSVITGQVAKASAAHGVSGTSTLQLRFQQLRLPDGRTTSLAAGVTSVGGQGGVGKTVTGGAKASNEGGVEQSKGRQTAGETAAGGAVGAVLGAIVGGGKGAAIGAIAGGGLGAVMSAKGGNLDLPAGTPLTISLTQALTVP